MLEKDEGCVKEISLLKKFEIPIQHLDYIYVRNCTDKREVERILRVLRSGEEGHFPDLIAAVEKRLETLDPASPLLRVELPVVRSQQMEKNERALITKDISEWIENLHQDHDEIFMGNDNDTQTQVPIRGQATITKKDGDDKPTKNSERIKSHEYEKWDKYDVEEALTRMEVREQQIDEWEKVEQVKKEKETAADVDRLMKNLDKKQEEAIPVDKPSFIEDITEQKKEKRRPLRVKVQIEDVNMGCF